VSFLEASDIILEDDVTDSVRGVKGIHAVLFCKWSQLIVFGGSTSNDEMNSIDENDKNESDVNPGQLVPVSNCHLQNSTACMPLTPRTESVTSSSNILSCFKGREIIQHKF
jgi:hypothetical protein